VAAPAIDKAGPRPYHFRSGPASGPATRPQEAKKVKPESPLTFSICLWLDAFELQEFVQNWKSETVGYFLVAYSFLHLTAPSHSYGVSLVIMITQCYHPPDTSEHAPP